MFVSCDALNTEGELVLMPSGVSLSYAYAPDASRVRGEGEGEFVGRRVGDATIACRVPSLGLVDDTPADLRIVPGLPYTIGTELDASIVTAESRWRPRAPPMMCSATSCPTRRLSSSRRPSARP